MDKVLCIGSAHIDRKAKAQNDVHLGTSIPVSVINSFGGVARNVAENLVRLECPVSLLSRVGNDMDGNEVYSNCQSLGIDVSLISRSSTCPTASYTALIDRKGDMVIALANMEIYEEVTPAVLEPMFPEMQKYPLCFVDTNFPFESLRFLLESFKGARTIFVDPVSVTKAEKLRGLLQNIDFLFPSRDEAESLSDISIQTPADAEKAGKKLHQMGARHVVITLGADGICVVDSNSSQHLPALAPDSICDVTGAGDALVAGVIYGMSASLSFKESIRYGIAAAALAIETNHTVNPTLTKERLIEKMKGIESCA